MKRILIIALALTMTLMFALPVAAMLIPEGYEWDGHSGVRANFADDYPGSHESAEPGIGGDEDQLLNGDYLDIVPISIDLDETDNGIEAISDYLDIEPISAQTDAGVLVVITYVALGVAVLALALAVVGLLKKK
jgi:hypothetical protein